MSGVGVAHLTTSQLRKAIWRLETVNNQDHVSHSLPNEGKTTMIKTAKALRAQAILKTNGSDKLTWKSLSSASDEEFNQFVEDLKEKQNA